MRWYLLRENLSAPTTDACRSFVYCQQLDRINWANSKLIDLQQSCRHSCIPLIHSTAWTDQFFTTDSFRFSRWYFFLLWERIKQLRRLTSHSWAFKQRQHKNSEIFSHAFEPERNSHSHSSLTCRQFDDGKNDFLIDIRWYTLVEERETSESRKCSGSRTWMIQQHLLSWIFPYTSVSIPRVSALLVMLVVCLRCLAWLLSTERVRWWQTEKFCWAGPFSHALGISIDWLIHLGSGILEIKQIEFLETSRQDIGITEMLIRRDKWNA